MLILSEEDIRGCFGMDDAIDAVAEAFESFSAGGAEVPLRTVQPIPGRDGNMIVMPGYVAEGKPRLSIAVGCTGGQHRSVTLAIATAEYLSSQGYKVTLTHRDLPRAQSAKRG